MAWIRLSDDYNDHPKFTPLSDGAFRLWHQGMGFCRKFKTDGLIPLATVRGFKAFTAKRMTELQTPWRAGEHALWQCAEGFGVKVHDYLDWNPSKEEEGKERDAAVARMRRLRLSGDAVGSVEVRPNNHRTFGVRSPNVPGGDGKGKKDLKEELRSKRPIFSGQRFTVFEWQLDGLSKLLGAHLEAFDLHSWFFDLDAGAVKANLVVPQRDGNAWLLAQALAEAQRRQLPIQTADSIKPVRDHEAESRATGERVLELLRRNGELQP